MSLRPVMTNEHSPQRMHLLAVVVVEPEATSSVLMVQCSRHAIPPAITVNLTDRRAHDLDVGLDDQVPSVLTRRRLGTILAHTLREMVDRH